MIMMKMMAMTMTLTQRIHNLMKKYEQWKQLLSTCSHHRTIISNDGNDKENDPDQ